MAQDYTADQLATVTALRQSCATILDTIAYARKVAQEAVDKGYTPGTPTTGITDALLQTGSPAPAPSLSAADITAAVNTINTLDSTLAATSRALYKTLEKLRS